MCCSLSLQVRASVGTSSQFPSMQARQEVIDTLGLIPPEFAALHRSLGHVRPSRVFEGQLICGGKRPPAEQVRPPCCECLSWLKLPRHVPQGARGLYASPGQLLQAVQNAAVSTATHANDIPAERGTLLHGCQVASNACRTSQKAALPHYNKPIPNTRRA
jgi:hypothetical protein